jgi:hypothetical protein
MDYGCVTLLLMEMKPAIPSHHVPAKVVLHFGAYYSLYSIWFGAGSTIAGFIISGAVAPRFGDFQLAVEIAKPKAFISLSISTIEKASRRVPRLLYRYIRI